MIFVTLVERYIYVDGNRKRRVASVGNTGKLPSRVAAVLAWRGALSSLPFLKQEGDIQSNNIILATNCNYVISPCVTNRYNYYTKRDPLTSASNVLVDKGIRVQSLVKVVGY